MLFHDTKPKWWTGLWLELTLLCSVYTHHNETKLAVWAIFHSRFSSAETLRALGHPSEKRESAKEWKRGPMHGGSSSRLRSPQFSHPSTLFQRRPGWWELLLSVRGRQQRPENLNFRGSYTDWTHLMEQMLEVHLLDGTPPVNILAAEAKRSSLTILGSISQSSSKTPEREPPTNHQTKKECHGAPNFYGGARNTTVQERTVRGGWQLSLGHQATRRTRILSFPFPNINRLGGRFFPKKTAHDPETDTPTPPPERQ